MVAKRYIMTGAPVTNVRTPAMLEARMASAGIDARVETRLVQPGELAGFMGEVRDDPTVDGLMVTMPHKRAVIPFLAAVSATAELVGSVNAVKRLATGNLVGAQFDGVALVRALSGAGLDIRNARILLLGFGGAGKAIAQAILAHGCAGLSVCDTALDARAIDAELQRLAPDAPAASWNGRGRFDILVNATPLGMGSGDPSPFGAGQVAAARCVADIVADPAETRLAQLAGTAGTRLVTGRDMVAAQIDPIFDWLRNESVDQAGFGSSVADHT